MKKILLAVIALSGTMTCLAQTDSTKNNESDTVKVGGMIIIKKHGENANGKEEKKVCSNNQLQPSLQEMG